MTKSDSRFPDEVHLCFEISNWYDPDFFIGLSVIFLKMNSIKAEVEITSDHNKPFIHTEISNNFDIPVNGYEDRHIVKSWYGRNSSYENFKTLQMSVTLKRNDLDPNIYFTVTSYKLSRSNSGAHACESGFK